jgi:hypothetical protein
MMILIENMINMHLITLLKKIKLKVIETIISFINKIVNKNNMKNPKKKYL